MKIAIFHELPVKSGSRKAVNEIAGRLKKNNTVDLYLVDSKETGSEKKYFNRIYFFKFNPVGWHGNNWKVRLKRDTLELFQLHKLHRKIAYDIRKRNYDAVFIHGSKFTESPFVLREQMPNKVYYAHAPNYTYVFENVVGLPKVNFVKSSYEKVNRILRRYLDFTNVRGADIILSNSEFTNKKIKKVYGRKGKVCYLGVDEQIYKHIITQKKYDVFYVGSTNPVDGLSLLDEAIGLLKNKLKTRKLLIEQEWIGDDKSLIKLYNQSRITVCLAYDEPFGLTAIESMACGVPVIAINEAGYKESVVDGKNGFLISRNAKELADRINYLLNHQKTYDKFCKNARIDVEDKWSWDKCVGYLEKEFRRISK